MLTETSESAVLAPVAPAPAQRLPVNGMTRALRQGWEQLTRHQVVLATIISSFGVFGLTAVQGILLARLLAPEGRGEYATAIFYTQTLLYIGFLGALVSIARRAAQRNLPAEQLRSAALQLGLYTGLGTAVVVSLLALIALPASKRGLAPLCIGCALLLPFEQMRLAISAVDHGIAAFKRYNATRLVAATLFPLLLLGVWLGGLMSVTVAALLTVVASLIGLLIHVAAVGGRAGFARSPVTAGMLLREGLPFAPGLIVGNLFPRIDVFLILWLADLSMQGLYAAAVPAATLMMVSANALELFAFNAGARQRGAGERGRMLRSAGLIFGIQAVSLAAFLFFLEPLVLFVYGRSFIGAVPFAQALLPSYAICGCATVAEGYLRGRGKTAISVWSRAVGALALLAVVGIGFQYLGPLAVAWGSFAGNTAIALCLTWAVWITLHDATVAEDEVALALHDTDVAVDNTTIRDALAPSTVAAIRIAPLRIGYLTNFITPYGLPFFTALSKRCRRLTVFVSTPMEFNRQWDADFGKLDVVVQKTWTVDKPQLQPTGFNEKRSFHFPLDTIRSLRRLRPDAVISAELGARSILAAVYCLLHRTPLVFWANLSEHTEHNRGWLRWVIRKALLRCSDAVIVNGPSGARYLQKMGYPAERTFRVPTATLPGVFDQNPLSRNPSRSHRLLSVGRLVEGKGVMPFVQALARWAQQHPERTLELCIVGSGPVYDELKAYQPPRNLQIELLGEQSYANLPGIYAQAGIFVFPTLADEWGLVANEALASGMPVLGSLYSQAVEEFCEDGVTGWTYRTDDEAGMAAAIDRALNTSHADLEAMRPVCRARIAAVDPERNADRVRRVLETIVARRTGKAPAASDNSNHHGGADCSAENA